MATSCDHPIKVTLKYTSVIPNKILYSGEKYHHASVNLGQLPRVGEPGKRSRQFFTITAPNLDTEITWEFHPSLINSWYRYPLSVTPAGTENAPIEYDAFFPGSMTDIGFWFESTGLARWKVGELTPSETTSSVKPGWYKVDSPINGASFKEILDISIGSGTIHNELGHAFELKIYFDGQYQSTHIVRSDTATPPDENIQIIEGKPGPEITKDITLPDIPEKVELIQSATSEYYWELTKISSEELQETVLSFAGIEPTLLCFIGEGECPQETCPVLCEDTICCYGADGISVTSFLKAESIY